jgi:hypothetical protein
MNRAGWARVVLVLGLGGLLGVGCVAGVQGRELRGPLRGQVVDVETGAPIPGAVVIAVWWEIVPTPVHGVTRFYDAQEAVTGPDGRFEIPGGVVPFFNLGVQPAQLVTFAPAYREAAIRVTPPEGVRYVAPTVVRMRRRTTREERLRNLDGRPPARVPNEKVPRLREALSKERVALGLSP